MITGSQGIWSGRGLGLHIQALHPLILYLGHHTLRAAGVIRKVTALWVVHRKSFYGSLILKVDCFISFFLKEKQLLYKFINSSNLGRTSLTQFTSEGVKYHLRFVLSSG